MKLDVFYRRIAPFLEGHQGLQETQRELFGDELPKDAGRLVIYERFCREHRNTATGGVHSVLREEVIAHRGASQWRQLVEDYFRAHPMRHVEINENGEHLAQYLAGRADLPPHWSELADFEWAEWQTYIAPDEVDDADLERGPLRLASTVDLRPYRWNFVEWLDEEPRAAAPPVESVLVLFWRNPQLRARRALAHPAELQILKAIHEGQPVTESETLADLRAAGIVLGIAT